jgi:hypothetical protein
MRSIGRLVALAAMAVVAPSLARAQSQLAIAEIERLARFAGDAPFCVDAGYTMRDPDGHGFLQAVSRVADRVGVSQADADKILAGAKTKEGLAMQAKAEAVKAGIKDPAGDKDLRAYADELAVKCHRIADDTTGTLLLGPPPGSATASVSRRYADKLLEPYGRAGWQTPRAVAAGDLAEAVGACESRQGKGQDVLAQLHQPYTWPSDIEETIYRYFDDRRAQGRRRPLPAAQCPALIAKREAAYRKLKF